MDEGIAESVPLLADMPLTSVDIVIHQEDGSKLVFAPKPDVTAYEVVLLTQWMGCHFNRGIMRINIPWLADRGLLRHFDPFEEPSTTPVPVESQVVHDPSVGDSPAETP